LKPVWVALLAISLGVAGCGGSGKTTATRSRTSTPATATTGSTPTAAGSASTDCNALGINPTGMREGTCTHAGITYTIVDENHTLRLQTLWAKLDAVRSSTALGAGAAKAANGRFIIASVTITNKLASPQSFDKAQTQQAGLILAGALFKEDVSAESTADANSCLRRSSHTPILPGRSLTCDVVFVVASAAAAQLGKHGSGDLYLVDFGSNLAGSIPPQRIGQIRLYH
jgi:hypothetical protein